MRRLAAILAITTLIAACGGGGGGDGTPAPTTPTPPQRPSPPVVTFPSAAQPAQINTSNAKAIATTAWVGAAPTDLLPMVLQALALYVPGTFEQTRTGFGGGTVTFRTDATQLWLSMDFTNYVHGAVTFNGRMVHVGAFKTTFEPYDVTEELTDFSARIGTATIKLTGTVHQVLVANTTVAFHLSTTSNLIAEVAGIPGKVSLQDATVNRTRPTTFGYEQTLGGRAYIEGNGYADISSDAPQAIVESELFPDRGGVFRLTGGNASVGVAPLTVDYVAVVLDDNNDHVDDRFSRERWSTLLSGTSTPDAHSPALANGGGSDITTVGVATPLDALLSHDADRSFIRTEWTLTVKPVGSATVLDTTKPLTPRFTPDLPGHYAFRVRAVDPDGNALDTVRYLATAQVDTVTPHVLMRLDRPPASSPGQAVSLDAGMSRRGAFNTLGPLPVLHSYRLRSPFGSAAALTAVSSPTSTFVPDLPGFYQVNVANNGTYPSQNVKHIGIGTGLQYDEAVHLETGGRLHYDPVLTDLDADGDTDFVVSGADRVTLARAIRVFLNTGGGFFTERQSFAFDDGAERILHGDLDGNGIVDLAAVGERTLFVVYNAATSSASTRQFALSRGVACTTISLFAEVTDANGDGDDDVLVVDACDHRVSIWTHTTGTTLVMSHQQTIANLIGYPIVFGDLNHDTRPDFVLPYAPGYPTPDAYVVYAQQSNHDFQVSATIETDLWTFSIGDASGDGLPDLVTSYAPNIRVFRQAAGGSLLTTPVVYDARSSFLPSPRFTDMNGDGLTDIVLTARADAMLLGLKQQNGSFTFLELPEDLLQGSSSNFALGDLDGNGIVDILRLRESFNDFGASVRFGVP